MWITEWSLIDEDKTYIVCPINKGGASGMYYLGSPQWSKGWQVVRLTKNCYAAIEVPSFNWKPKE